MRQTYSEVLLNYLKLENCLSFCEFCCYRIIWRLDGLSEGWCFWRKYGESSNNFLSSLHHLCSASPGAFLPSLVVKSSEFSDQRFSSYLRNGEEIGTLLSPLLSPVPNWELLAGTAPRPAWHAVRIPDFKLACHLSQVSQTVTNFLQAVLIYLLCGSIFTSKLIKRFIFYFLFLLFGLWLWLDKIVWVTFILHL